MTPWRDLAPHFHVAGHEIRAQVGSELTPGPQHNRGLSSPRAGGQLAAAAPTVDASAQRPLASGASTTPFFECRVGGCRERRFSERTGFCEAHHDRFLSFCSEHSRDVGRGR